MNKKQFILSCALLLLHTLSYPQKIPTSLIVGGAMVGTLLTTQTYYLIASQKQLKAKLKDKKSQEAIKSHRQYLIDALPLLKNIIERSFDRDHTIFRVVYDSDISKCTISIQNKHNWPWHCAPDKYPDVYKVLAEAYQNMGSNREPDHEYGITINNMHGYIEAQIEQSNTLLKKLSDDTKKLYSTPTLVTLGCAPLAYWALYLYALKRYSNS